METFIYYCKNDKGEEMTFISKALIDTGVTVFDNDLNPFTIVDFDVNSPISAAEDAMEHTLERLMERW